MSEQTQGVAHGGRESIHWALMILTALGLTGTAIQLAMERHWSGPWQIPPWVALLGTAAALIVLLVSTGRLAVMLARAMAAIVLIVSLVGFWQHFASNYAHGEEGDTHVAHTASSDEQAEEEGHSHDDDHKHSHDDDEHDADEESSAEADSDEVAAEEDASVMDVLTGAAAHTPLLAPFALVQVALTLATATIGLGGSPPAASRRRRS
jgi:uncharacterized membrane protein YcjF (UPF0283 family)